MCCYVLNETSAPFVVLWGFVRIGVCFIFFVEVVCAVFLFEIIIITVILNTWEMLF